jgi:hypothetical protein
MARIRQSSLGIATIIMLQLGLIVHLEGQDTPLEARSNSPVQNSSESVTNSPDSRERVDRVLTLPAIPPSLEEITLHILTDPDQ